MIQDALEVSTHGYTTRSFGVVPFEIDVEIFGAFPVFGDGVV